MIYSTSKFAEGRKTLMLDRLGRLLKNDWFVWVSITLAGLSSVLTIRVFQQESESRDIEIQRQIIDRTRALTERTNRLISDSSALTKLQDSSDPLSVAIAVQGMT